MKNHFCLITVLVLSVLLFAGCGHSEAEIATMTASAWMPTPPPPTPTPIIVPGIDEFVWANGVEIKIISITEQDEYEDLRITNDEMTFLVVTIEFGEGDVPKHIWSRDKMYLTDDINMLTQETASTAEVVFGKIGDPQQIYIFIVRKGSKGYVLHFVGEVKVPLSSLEK